tara:strand:- start:981 stop:1139 length:159 start_codon:yes stop_codon:yes gene_type:complete
MCGKTGHNKTSCIKNLSKWEQQLYSDLSQKDIAKKVKDKKMWSDFKRLFEGD